MDTNLLLMIGIVLIIAGFVVIMIAAAGGGGNIKVGVGGFIGPIPFGWANDSETLKWIMAIVAIVAIFFLILVLRGFI